ncbi:DUF6382 domain-containing protein [Paenibacillus sp. JCM 10914]|uniref:DUF6382 domain-containing protein n=1 Tax=Paenibacillus sp. JCM 10914 TaxID=1236974 RepID=UPI0003CC3F8D|nr:DUF6382 domain-containing protein [Paenibacillus sp. JCM 10914]GAE09724.1 hypothetical protein JCM10914_6102 [Paenibacillus sp. JCM 10914]
MKLHVKEIDDRVTLEYDISGKKMLSQSLKGERLSLTEYYGLLLQIATALDDSKSYMLHPDNYVLQEDYIFIEGSMGLGTLYLTYLPLVDLRDTQDLGRNIKDFMMRLLAAVTELRGGGVQALMSFCGEPCFSLRGLKRLIIELLAGEDEGTRQSEVPHPMNSPDASASHVNRVKNGRVHSLVQEGAPFTAKNAASAKHSVHHVVGKHQPERVDRVDQPQAIPDQTDNWFKRANYRNHSEERLNAEAGQIPSKSTSPWFHSHSNPPAEDDPTDTNSNSPLRTYIMLGCLLAAAGIWRLLYMNNPGSLTLILSVSGTLLLAVISWLVWMGKLKPGKRMKSEWSAELPMFDSVELSSTGRSSWKSAPRFEADPLSEILTGKAAADSMNTGDEGSNRARYSGLTSGYSSGHTQAESTGLDVHSKPEDDDSMLSYRTEVLASSIEGSTVTLAPEKASRMIQSTAYLECVGPNINVPQRIELSQPHFIIGRSAEVAQHVAEGTGISRAHVEVSREGNEYRLKDLGSINGTSLRGEAMVPYKEYPIQEGDSFIITGISFTLRLT